MDTSSSVRRPTAARRAAKKPANRVVSKSRLIPRLERKSAKLGEKDDSLLRMLCDDTESGGQKELHFRNMVHSQIDWDNALHINKINNWRNQVSSLTHMFTHLLILAQDIWTCRFEVQGRQHVAPG